MQLRGLLKAEAASGGEANNAAKRGRAAVSFADLFSGPSLQEAAAASKPLPPSAPLKRGGRAKSSTTLSLGSMLRGAPSKPARPAIVKGSGGKGTGPTLLHRQQLPRRGKLRRENAERKQRLSHVKRLVLQVREEQGASSM